MTVLVKVKDVRRELRPPRNRIERRAILWWTLNALIWGIFLVGGSSVAYALFDDIRWWMGPTIWVLAVIYAVNILIMPTWRYLIHRWEITDVAVYQLQGWLTREWRIIPISRIQSIEAMKGPLEQALGLATLKVTTASRRGGITLQGLDATVADDAAHRLTEITQATPGDAT